ncbi:MAG: SurA N-terminal domain-containing protein [Pseudomonadales bacterium]
MLQKLRDQTQNTGFKILVGAIIVVLTLFGFGATNLFTGADPEIAAVGDFSITQNVLAVETERERMRILNRMGPEFDPANIDRQQLSEYVIQQVINRQIIYQTAEELGIQVPQEEVNETLTSSPAYQVDGQFNESIYRQTLQTLGYSPVEFLQEFTSALSSETLQQGVSESLAMTDWELGELIRVINQRRDLAYLPLTVANYLDQVEVNDEEVRLRYEEDEATFMTELALDVEYLSLSVDALVDALQDDERLTVTDQELQVQYDEERASALRDEQRDSSHILVSVNAERDDQAALALIEDAARRIAAGEDFAAVAEEISEDPGSAQAGGSLGPVGKGIFDPAFETALWALAEAGDISEPVRSSFGYHLIRLDEIVDKEYPSLESQREALTETIQRVKAQDIFADMARELEERAYDEQVSLTQTADALELELQVARQVTQATSEGKLSVPALQDAAFSEAVLAGENSNAIALGEDEMVVLRVAEQYPPELKPFAEVEAEIRDNLQREKALALIEEYKARGLEMLEAGASTAEIALELGSSWETYEAAGRSPSNAQEAELPNEVRTFAFSLPRPPQGEKSVGVVDLADGAALVTVTRVVQGDIDSTLAQETEELRRAAVSRGARLDFQSLLQAAEQSLGVERPALLSSTDLEDS